MIVTRRLLLSPLAAGDAPAMYGYRGDPDVCRFQTFEPGSLKDVEDLIAGLQPGAFATPGSWSQYAIRIRDTGELAGDLGIQVLASDPRQAEIGFTVAPAHQRRGYGTEAVAGMLGYLLGPARKHRVIASVDPRNAPSLALLKRVGMRQEAHFRESLWFKGAWVDDVVFGILASEWVGGETSVG